MSVTERRTVKIESDGTARGTRFFGADGQELEELRYARAVSLRLSVDDEPGNAVIDVLLPRLEATMPVDIRTRGVQVEAAKIPGNEWEVTLCGECGQQLEGEKCPDHAKAAPLHLKLRRAAGWATDPPARGGRVKGAHVQALGDSGPQPVEGAPTSQLGGAGVPGGAQLEEAMQRLQRDIQKALAPHVAAITRLAATTAQEGTQKPTEPPRPAKPEPVDPADEDSGGGACA